MNHIPKKYYIANWKTYQSISTIKRFIQASNQEADWHETIINSYIGIAASYEHLYYLHKKISKLAMHLGSQDCSAFLPGAYTGQVSIESLQDMNISFCLVGHSEVRAELGQSDMLISSKFKMLLAANISPIMCIGETLAQKNDGMALQVLYDQLEHILNFLQSYTGSTKIFIAYEPRYCIGTGIIPSSDDLQKVFCFLKSLVQQLPIAKNVMFLYGGSVSSKTVQQLHDIKEISGFLIGKASIDFQELKKIVQSDGRMV